MRLTDEANRFVTMPTRDLIHNAVKTALGKDGWTITADPCVIQYEDVMLFADLAAHRTLAAEREGRRIGIEVKSFLRSSQIADFENALGQYLLYRTYLEETNPEYEMFLAVAETVFDDFFQREAIRLVLERFDVKVISVRLEKEEIVAWTN